MIFSFFYITKKQALDLLIILIICLTIATLIRIVYFKPRPNKARTDTLWLRLYNSSFPSVHAMRAMILAYFFTLNYSHIITITMSWILAILVCYSRIYLKKHDLKDIIAGAIIGFLLCIFLL